MPSEEPPDENPSTEEDEPILPPELQHTHAMSACGFGDPKDPCEVTRSWLMDIARM